MTLGITSVNYVVGGIASNNRNIVAALAHTARKAGDALEVISFWDDPGNRPTAIPEGVAFTACGGSKLGFALRLMASSLRSRIAVLDHVGLALPLLVFAGVGLVRTVIFAHGSEGWWRLTRSGRWSYRRAALVLTNSPYTLDRMRKAFHGFRGQACLLGLPADVTLNMVMPEPVRIELSLEAADGALRQLDRYFLLVGRIDSTEGQKGHAELEKAIASMANTHPDVQLVFAGPGDGRDRLVRDATKLGIADRVFLPGRVSNATLQALYRGCQAYVMPSLQEGFGIVYLEAMNWAKACVGCHNDGAADVIVDGETGILIRDRRDVEELAMVLKKLLDEPGLATRMGAAGFGRLHRQFTSDAAQQRICSAIEGLRT